MEIQPWRPSPTTCANAACGADLRKVAVMYTVRGKDIGFCSQACRATVTKEQVRTAPAAVEMTAAPAAEPAPKGKGKVPKPATAPAAKAKAPRSKQPVNGVLHITKKDVKFSGQRAAVWALVKEGMTLQALYDAAAKAGLNGKGVLAKIMVVGKCVEIRG